MSSLDEHFLAQARKEKMRQEITPEAKKKFQKKFQWSCIYIIIALFVSFGAMAGVRSKDNKKIDFKETILAFLIFNLTFIWLMYFVIELYRCRAIEQTSFVFKRS